MESTKPGSLFSWITGIVGLLGLICMVAMAVRLQRLETEMVEKSSLTDAAHFSDAIREFRTLYTSEVVDRVENQELRFTHDYAEHEGELPLPATLSMLLGTRLSKTEGGSIRLYSDYPFEGGFNSETKLDDFEQAALQQLRKAPYQPVYRFTETDQGTVLRYATADIMREACVDCHNNHDDSPFTQWKEGDVRGVLEVIRPMSAQVLQTRSDIRATVWLLLAISFLTLGIIGLAAMRLRRARALAQDSARDALQAIEERESIELQALQTQKLESLGLLAGGIAHDFNNLLVSILGNAELAELHLGSDSPAVRHLQLVKTAGDRAANLTTQLLAYAGQGQLRTRALDLNQTVEEFSQLLHTAVVRRADVVMDLCPELPLIEGDPSQLEQVVLNLITNAAEAIVTPPGRIRLRTGIEDEGRVFVEVQDSGCGMDESTRAQMFDPFFSNKAEGRGLGLSAILGIVHAHGGEIRVDSTEGRGTTIRVVLPSAEHLIMATESPKMASPLRGEGRVILVIDDDEDSRRTTLEILQTRGFEVISAGSGPEGIALYQEHRERIFALVLDMTMPGMGGMEAFEAMEAIDPELRVVMVSGFTVESRLKTLIATKRIRFLSKPFRMDELVEALLTD
jgi:signal transduction histidine kinase